jgi:hypothetical protein
MIYFVTTITGNVRNAGTDANVFIEIEGSLGKTSPHRLNNGKKNMFERGIQDNFNVRKIFKSLGDQKSLDICFFLLSLLTLISEI